MAANASSQLMQPVTCTDSDTVLQDFVLAFNGCPSPKEVLRLVQNFTKLYTASISIRSESVHVLCAGLAGSPIDECCLPLESRIEELASKIQSKLSNDEFPATSLSFLVDDGSEVDRSEHVKDHLQLVVKACLSAGDVGRVLYRAGSQVCVELLGQCLGHHNDFWKELAASYPMNFTCFAGMDIVKAIRSYLWTFRLPGEAAQIERIVDGFACSYFHHNSTLGSEATPIVTEDINDSDGESSEEHVDRAPRQHRSCWDEVVRGWYVDQPRSGPKLLPCCIHCGELDGEKEALALCQGCNAVYFCRRCRRDASRYGHAVVGTLGYGRACVAAKCATKSVGSYWEMTYQRSLRGDGKTETCIVSEDCLNWIPASPFRTQDSVMILAYSIIMLTTNLHSANVKDKMKKHEFIKQNRDVNGGGNFPGDFLAKIFDDIQQEELKVMRKTG
jgi:hypothetical protein